MNKKIQILPLLVIMSCYGLTACSFREGVKYEKFFGCYERVEGKTIDLLYIDNDKKYKRILEQKNITIKEEEITIYTKNDYVYRIAVKNYYWPKTKSENAHRTREANPSVDKSFIFNTPSIRFGDDLGYLQTEEKKCLDIINKFEKQKSEN